MKIPPATCTRGRQRGTVLVVTMILVFALAGVTLVLCRSMRVEMIASANYAAGLKASAVERGAEQYLMAMLAQESSELNSITEDYFTAIPVGDGYFWVLRPDYGDSSLPLFGLVDEAAKLNINVATYDQLMMLPCMTDDVAAAIVDWRDEDSNASPGGAEDEYYLSQPDAYYTKNAAFESVEELSLVRGVWPDLLYGSGDAPPLGSMDLISTIGSRSGSSMLEDVWLQRGIFELLTIWGAESTTAADGTQRVNISTPGQNQQLRELLQNQLGQQRGDQIADAVGSGVLIDVFDLYFRGKMTPTEFAQIADYITSGAQAQPTGGQGGQGGQAAQGGQSQSGTSSTTATTPKPSGKINVNWGPREVLLTLPNLETTDVDKLVAARQGLSATDLESVAWVADALGEKAVGLGNSITARSSQHSALILAVSGDGRGFKLVRVVIDTTSTTPQIIYRRDLTERGWPMDTQILTSLRTGQGPGSWAGNLGSSLGGLRR
jgi:DNA uptake protein ComE-like DNA-binding protein